MVIGGPPGGLRGRGCAQGGRARPPPSWAGCVSVFWEWGSPNLPACGLWRGSGGGPAQDPREGPSLTGRMTGSFLRSSLVRQAREEAERSRQGTSRGARDASHDDRDQAGARRAPTCAVSLFPLRCKGGKHKPRHQAKVTISVQRDQDQRSSKMEVTVEPRTASLLKSLAVEDQLWLG